MAATRKRLSVTEFDFDEVKDNLKVFMRNQTEFKDYDFEGSGLSALLDVLAYNTHYLGFNANMLQQCLRAQCSLPALVIRLISL